ncbi:ABC transporter permease [bacterium]|nr:ABC transporter permease [bacterium]
MSLIPGSVISQLVDQAAGSDPEKLAEMEAFLGLDRPWYAQLGSWLANVVQGDLGNSWRSRIPVADLLGPRLMVTLQLSAMATVISSLVLGIPGGLIAAAYKSRWPDSVVRVVSLLALSVPVFWMGSMLILVFSVWFNWSPPLTWVSPFEDFGANMRMMILPAIALGLAGAAPLVRMTRNSILEVMGQNYIRTARSTGATEGRIRFRHALRNAIIPVVTSAGLQFGFLIGGAVVIEEVFSLPGVGRLLLQAISQRDFPVVQACVLTIGIFLIFLNIAVDILYAYLDPRIKLGD